ncbi:MAG TPA: CaiB/BaiF CoA-transferase family protein [Dehalococcoidia bacterium]|nr:CaiB/BaiF CoA-transferase family protein [Dehalococcoidia bacterium]
MPPLPSHGPLAGLTVLDLTWVLSGPFAAMTLSDLGADVVKVERPPYGDIARTTGPHLRSPHPPAPSPWNGEGVAAVDLEESAYFFSINRGKRSVAIDLRGEQGKAAFRALVCGADVVLENFTPGTMDRLGLGYEALRAINPRLVYCAISGFGQTGPDRDLPALDVIVQGMGGLMSITGEPGRPPVRVGTSIGNVAAGLYATIGILAALRERDRSGEGQFVDIAMLDCQLAIQENAFSRYFASGKTEIPGPLGTRHPSATPFQAFPTKDGYIVVALAFGAENQWQLLCGILGVVELLDDERFETSGKRTANHAALEPILNAAFAQRSTAEWLAELRAAGIPCGPVNNIAEVAASPQVAAREMLQTVTHPKGMSLTIVNTPVKLSRTPGGIKGPPPSVGQDTRTVLRELGGLDEDRIEALLAAGVVLETDPRTAPTIPH